MAEHHPEIVIIKRHSSHDEEHHGGAWKIAFADFMTAMMAFFLVLWIINATDKDTKTVIARYFNPVKLEDTAKAKKGIRAGTHSSGKDEVGDPNAPETQEKTDSSPTPGKNQASAKDSDKPGEKAKDEKGKDDKGKDDKAKDEKASESTDLGDPAKTKPTTSETALFKDPYASLERIAGPLKSNDAKAGESNGDAVAAGGGVPDLDAFRDPFEPIARGVQGAMVVEPEREPKISSAKLESIKNDAGSLAPPPGTSPTESVASSGVLKGQPPGPEKGGPTLAVGRNAAPNLAAGPNVAGAPGAAPQAADAGAEGRGANGPPVARANGDAQSSTTAADKKGAAASTSAEAEQPRNESAKAGADKKTSAEAMQLRNEVAKSLRNEIMAQPAPGVEVRSTDEGVLISLTDAFDFSMFAIGSAEPQAKVVRIMEKIAESLKDRPGSIVLRGHTDARPFKSATYDNWRLSSARAQMAYYMLVRGGLPESRFERVEGYGAHQPRVPSDPLASENRRIEILLRPQKP
jgi:chemotaxis protein MotB